MSYIVRFIFVIFLIIILFICLFIIIFYFNFFAVKYSLVLYNTNCYRKTMGLRTILQKQEIILLMVVAARPHTSPTILFPK